MYPSTGDWHCIRDAMDDSSEIEREVTGKRLKTAGMFSLITHPAILDIVESIIGPEILAHPQFNCQAKMPNETRSQIPWHQDLGFLHPEAEATFMVNFWIPLVDVTVENGCLEVIPGSHRAGLMPHGEVRGYPNEGNPGRVRTRRAAGSLSRAKGRRGGVPAQDRAPLVPKPDGPHPVERGRPLFRSFKANGA